MHFKLVLFYLRIIYSYDNLSINLMYFHQFVFIKNIFSIYFWLWSAWLFSLFLFQFQLDQIWMLKWIMEVIINSWKLLRHSLMILNYIKTIPNLNIWSSHQSWSSIPMKWKRISNITQANFCFYLKENYYDIKHFTFKTLLFYLFIEKHHIST